MRACVRACAISNKKYKRFLLRHSRHSSQVTDARDGTNTKRKAAVPPTAGTGGGGESTESSVRIANMLHGHDTRLGGRGRGGVTVSHTNGYRKPKRTKNPWSPRGAGGPNSEDVVTRSRLLDLTTLLDGSGLYGLLPSAAAPVDCRSVASHRTAAERYRDKCAKPGSGRSAGGETSCN